MKSNYEVRAQKFIRLIYDYLTECVDTYDFEIAVESFNHNHHRHVMFSHGLTRVALITSDYVVKIDYDAYQVRRFGGGENECAFYRIAEQEGYGYLFAKVSRYQYRDITFYIMPRIKGIGRYEEDATEFMTDEENDWCFDHGLCDLHNFNYGWKNGHIIIFDYGANAYS